MQAYKSYSTDLDWWIPTEITPQCLIVWPVMPKLMGIYKTKRLWFLTESCLFLIRHLHWCPLRNTEVKSSGPSTWKDKVKCEGCQQCLFIMPVCYWFQQLRKWTIYRGKICQTCLLFFSKTLLSIQKVKYIHNWELPSIITIFFCGSIHWPYYNKMLSTLCRVGYNKLTTGFGWRGLDGLGNNAAIFIPLSPSDLDWWFWSSFVHLKSTI